MSNAFYYIQAKHSGKCLDVSGESTDDNAEIIQYHQKDSNSGNQNFRLIPCENESGFYYIQAKHSGKNLDISGNSLEDGAQVIQYHHKIMENDNQKFRLVPCENESDYFYIQAKHSGKCLDISGESISDGAKVIQYHHKDGNNDNQKFKLILVNIL